MNYKTVKCLNCGNNFVWSSEEQDLYNKRRLPDPEYCPICRGIIEARSRDKQRSKYEQ
jgi:NAD-dependent SIR2 family protein deacetylase